MEQEEVQDQLNDADSPSPHQGIVDPPDNVITEGGGKRYKLSSPSSVQLSTGRSTVGSAEAVVEKPSLEDDLPVMDNRGDVN